MPVVKGLRTGDYIICEFRKYLIEHLRFSRKLLFAGEIQKGTSAAFGKMPAFYRMFVFNIHFLIDPENSG